MRAQISARELPFGTDLDALDRFLRSDRTPPNCMMLSELDGFLWGIAVGPERVLPSEWMPHVWGGESPTFTDRQEGQTFLDLISTRYTAILHNVAHGVVDPIFWTDRDGKITAADWAEGFRQAVALRPDAWKPLIVSEYARFLLVPIFALCLDQDGKTGLDLPPERERSFIENATELIPACISRIAEFWREGGLKRTSMPFATSPRSGPGRTPAKIGRNDPCSCGSGRKFKRCCGRNK